MFSHHIDLLNGGAAGNKHLIQFLEVLMTYRGIESLLNQRRAAARLEKKNESSLVAARQSIKDGAAGNKTCFRRNWMAADESLPTWQSAGRSGRRNQYSLRKAIRRKHIDQSFGHRKGSFANGNGNKLRKIRKIDCVVFDVNALTVAIELALKRRVDIDCGERFTENAEGRFFHGVSGKRRRMGREFCHFSPSASALRALGGRLPSKYATRLFAAITAIFVRVSTEALAICGVRITSFRPSRAGLAFGSASNTSRAAPAIFFCRNASASAASSTTGPRDVLIKYAVRFILSRLSSEIRCRVSGKSGT